MHQIGRYQLLEEVARGGMGAVWRARSPEGRVVALKLLHAGRGATPQQRGRFKNEVQTLMRLRHPGVVRLEDAGEHEGAPWLCLEWIEGETLGARLARGGWLPIEEAVELLAELCLAVEACHAEGVLHRDLKPDNVLIRRADGAPLLTDFGLARELAPDQREAMTRTGQWLGTPGYWAPEQAHGRRDAIGPATDVYGLGAVLYAVLTGRAPHEASTIQEHLQALERAPTPPSRWRPELPGWLDAVCVRALARQPEQRLPSAAALRQELLRGLIRSAGPRRRGALVIALLSAGVLAGAGGGALLALRPRVASPSSPADPLLPHSAPPPAGAPPPPGQASQAGGEEEEEPPGDPAARAHLERARQLRDAGDPAGARRALEDGLAIDPSDPLLRFGRAVIREADGELAGALEDLEVALERWPRAGKVLALKVSLLTSLERFDEAARAVKEGIAAAPGYGELHLMRGFLLDRKGDLPGALAAMTRAQELDPGSTEIRVRRALHLAERMQRLPEGLAELDAALALDPGSGRLHAVRASLRRMGGDLSGAEADLARAHALDPACPEAWLQRGFLRSLQGDLAAARDDLRHGLSLIPPHDPGFRSRIESELEAIEARQREVDAHVERARQLRARHELREALAELDAAVGLAARDVTARFGRALVRKLLADDAGALAEVEAALAFAPQDGRLWSLKVTLLTSQGRTREARAAVEEGLRHAPGHAQLHLVLGELLTAGGDLPGALRAYTRGIELEPQVEGLVRRAVLYLEYANDPLRARADLDRAIELDPREARPWALRSGLRRRVDDWSGAWQDVNRAHELDPNCAEAWLHRGLLRRGQGDLLGGLNDLARALALSAPGDGKFQQALGGQIAELLTELNRGPPGSR